MRRSAGQRNEPGEAMIRHIWQEHGGAMLAYAAHLTRDRTGAEDIVQEALVRAWRHADDLVEERGSVRGWLLTVVRNIVTDRVRARAARAHEVGPGPIDAAVADDHAGRVVDAVLVDEALRRLIPEHRIVLEYVYLRGFTVADTAAALGIPPGTVKSRTYYALRTLRQMFPHPPAAGEPGADVSRV